VLEGILARGDRRLGPVIEMAYLGGARFDSWDDQLRLDLWEKAFEHFGIEKQRYLSTIPVNGRVPWDHIDVGLEAGFLAREYRKALKNRLSPPCGKVAGMFVHHTNVQDAQADARRLVCYDCGVACDLGQMRSERISFLDKMDAKLPGQRARLPLITQERTDKIGPERMRPVQSGGAARRWRLQYTKLGAAALLGHLDLMRELPRIIRRAGVRTAYTEGFHPKPDVSMAPALALGALTLCELIDIKLITDLAVDQLLDKLNQAATPGIQFVALRELGPHDAAVNRVISVARYLIVLAEQSLTTLGGTSEVTRRIDAFNAAERVEVRRDVQGIGKQVNVRGAVREMRFGDAADAQLLVTAGLLGRLCSISVTLGLDQNGSARPSEVVTALFGSNDFPHTIVRVELSHQGHSPLDLEKHRRTPTAKANSEISTESSAAG
ncbi:MAG TPA: TIGR03936 family radical SAM-associated protein, partial [Polyangiaceae bacterium]|nr:TIGR03936 family radical SAM-associated protein [Polyangiaceae bacterium]